MGRRSDQGITSVNNQGAAPRGPDLHVVLADAGGLTYNAETLDDQ